MEFVFTCLSPTFGISGQKDFLPKIVNNAGTSSTEAIMTKNMVGENNGAKLCESPKFAKNNTSMATRTVPPENRTGRPTPRIAYRIASCLFSYVFNSSRYLEKTNSE